MAADLEVRDLYSKLLNAWNTKDAAAYSELFSDDGTIVGFDGTSMQTPGAILEHLSSIFADHDPAAYVCRIVEVRALGATAMLLRAHAGMLPPGGSDIAADRNAVQVLIAVDTPNGWRIAHFHNTPATFDGRPEEVEELTNELQALVGPA